MYFMLLIRYTEFQYRGNAPVFLSSFVFQKKKAKFLPLDWKGHLII